MFSVCLVLILRVRAQQKLTPCYNLEAPKLQTFISVILITEGHQYNHTQKEEQKSSVIISVHLFLEQQ